MSERRWLTVAHIVADLGVSDETVYGWLRSGDLRSKRFGREYRIRADWYAAWCESRPDGETSAERVQTVQRAPLRRPAQRPGGRVTRLLDMSALREQRSKAMGES